MLEDVKAKAAKAQADSHAQMLSRAAQYHRAFVQNESGQKIYGEWVRRVLNQPPSNDPNELLRREGLRQIVKEITDHITIIEQRSEHG